MQSKTYELFLTETLESKTRGELLCTLSWIYDITILQHFSLKQGNNDPRPRKGTFEEAACFLAE
jgi:hypothetical protein